MSSINLAAFVIMAYRQFYGISACVIMAYNEYFGSSFSELLNTQYSSSIKLNIYTYNDAMNIN